MIRTALTKLALPEPAAIALAERLELFAETLERREPKKARKPGRPRLDKYRQAADLYRDGEISFHELCLKLEPPYSTAGKERQRKMRDAMRAGVLRFGRRH